VDYQSSRGSATGSLVNAP